MYNFKSTYLYIKQHSVTGLLYFGKTTQSEKYLLIEYKGSGDYWGSHIKKHGKKHVETIWYCLFNEKEECNKFALMCSEQWDIVNAKDKNGKKIWANVKPENGLDGGILGSKQSIETIQKRLKSLIGQHRSEKVKQNMRKPKSERAKENMRLAQQKKGSLSEKTKDKIREARKNQIFTEKTKKKLSGKVIVVDKEGNRFKISKEQYHSQTGPKSDWKWIFHRCNEANSRMRR